MAGIDDAAQILCLGDKRIRLVDQQRRPGRLIAWNMVAAVMFPRLAGGQIRAPSTVSSVVLPQRFSGDVMASRGDTYAASIAWV